MDIAKIRTQYNNPEMSDLSIYYSEDSVSKSIYCHKLIICFQSNTIKDMVLDSPDKNSPVDLSTSSYKGNVISTVIKQMYGIDLEVPVDNDTKNGYASLLLDCIEFADYLNAEDLINLYVKKFSENRGSWSDDELRRSYLLGLSIKNSSLRWRAIDNIIRNMDYHADQTITLLFEHFNTILDDLRTNGGITLVEEFMLRYRVRLLDEDQWKAYMMKVSFTRMDKKSLLEMAKLKGVSELLYVSNLLISLAELKEDSNSNHRIPITEVYVESRPIPEFKPSFEIYKPIFGGFGQPILFTGAERNVKQRTD